MARTGININISNTVLAPPASANSNSMLIVVGAKATSAVSGTVAFELGMPYKLTSANDLANYGITEADNKDLYEQVNDFYQPKAYVNNSGTILWIVGLADYTSKIEDKLPLWVKYTTVGGNEYRPRQILISNDPTKMTSAPDVTKLQAAVMKMYAQAFSTCIITDVGVITGNISELEDLSTKASGMVGVVTFTKRQGSRAAVGAVGGWVSTLSVGTSMGDGSLSAFGTDLFFVDGAVSDSTVTWANSPCASASQATIDALSDKQYIFPISRPPENGLWINDGSTAEDSSTALCTIEAARTIASVVDDLRAFFNKYLNTKIPTSKSGDIQSTFKQVMLDAARASVIQPYIDSGDISDATIQIVAKNNDMQGTRTLEVTLGIQQAITLRWVEGFVFYVKSVE